VTTFLPFICRISGGMALQRDIHASVSEQIKKNFYKAKWKVMYRKVFLRFKSNRGCWGPVFSSEKVGGGMGNST